MIEALIQCETACSSHQKSALEIFCHFASTEFSNLEGLIIITRHMTHPVKAPALRIAPWLSRPCEYHSR